MAKRPPAKPPLEPREFRSRDEIAQAITKLERRVGDVTALDVVSVVRNQGAEDQVVASSLRETIREVFGALSPEFDQYQHLQIWSGPMGFNMDPAEVLAAKERGKTKVVTILRGLIDRLKEKAADLEVGGASRAPRAYLPELNLHPRIADVAVDRFIDGYPWDAVFAAAKALVNYVKERSRSDLDGATLMRTVFSKQNPILAFNELADQTDFDEQEGMMHLFEGAVLAIRNPGGHSFPEGSDQRAAEYLQLLSLLAYRTQEATRRSR